MKLLPDMELREPRGDADAIHVCVSPEDGTALSLWVMACGISTIADEDGNLSPEIDFYEERYWQKATCARCRAPYERQGGI